MDKCGKRTGLLFLLVTPRTNREVIPRLPITLDLAPSQAAIERYLRERNDVLMLLPFAKARRLKKDYPDNCVLIAFVRENELTAFLGEDINMADYVVAPVDPDKITSIIQAEQSRRAVINVQADHATRHIYQDTATAIILNKSQTEILLIKRGDNGRWFPPGGHVDRGELPYEAVLREVREETGYDARFLHQPDNMGEAFDLAIITPQPYCILLEDMQTHYHHDFIYLCSLTEYVGTAEGETRWFSLEEVQQIASIPEDVKRVAAGLQVPRPSCNFFSTSLYLLASQIEYISRITSVDEEE
jgi:8-oxo-dGTP pyrophosphatase MutT (NUDIX family)